MKLEILFLACNSMASADNFQISIVKDNEMIELLEFDNYYKIPFHIRNKYVRCFEVGNPHYIILES